MLTFFTKKKLKQPSFTTYNKFRRQKDYSFSKLAGVFVLTKKTWSGFRYRWFLGRFVDYDSYKRWPRLKKRRPIAQYVDIYMSKKTREVKVFYTVRVLSSQTLLETLRFDICVSNYFELFEGAIKTEIVRGFLYPPTGDTIFLYLSHVLCTDVCWGWENVKKQSETNLERMLGYSFLTARLLGRTNEPFYIDIVPIKQKTVILKVPATHSQKASIDFLASDVLCRFITPAKLHVSNSFKMENARISPVNIVLNELIRLGFLPDTSTVLVKSMASMAIVNGIRSVQAPLELMWFEYAKFVGRRSKHMKLVIKNKRSTFLHVQAAHRSLASLQQEFLRDGWTRAPFYFKLRNAEILFLLKLTEYLRAVSFFKRYLHYAFFFKQALDLRLMSPFSSVNSRDYSRVLRRRSTTGYWRCLLNRRVEEFKREKRHGIGD